MNIPMITNYFKILTQILFLQSVNQIKWFLKCIDKISFQMLFSQVFRSKMNLFQKWIVVFIKVKWKVKLIK